MLYMALIINIVLFGGCSPILHLIQSSVKSRGWVPWFSPSYLFCGSPSTCLWYSSPTYFRTKPPSHFLLALTLY